MPEFDINETDETDQLLDSAFFRPRQLQLLRKQGNLEDVNSLCYPSRLMVSYRAPEPRQIPIPSSKVDKRELKELEIVLPWMTPLRKSIIFSLCDSLDSSRGSSLLRVPKDVVSKNSHLPRNRLNRGISGPEGGEFVCVLQYHLINAMPACQPKKRSCKGLFNYVKIM